MLTVFGGQGSPGASTTALHIAALWASAGKEVLLIEADPAGGTLSPSLGIQFTPGSASLFAAANHLDAAVLIDHSQDVLYDTFHVMPAPGSRTGARSVVEQFSDLADELRQIAYEDMAVIIDAGRVAPDVPTSKLVAASAGVLLVVRGSEPASIEHVLPESLPDDGPEWCVATVGQSAWSEQEWAERARLRYVGHVDTSDRLVSDISTLIASNRRKTKRQRAALQALTDNLMELARPRNPREAAALPEAAVEGLAEPTETSAGSDEPFAPASPEAEQEVVPGNPSGGADPGPTGPEPPPQPPFGYPPPYPTPPGYPPPPAYPTPPGYPPPQPPFGYPPAYPTPPGYPPPAEQPPPQPPFGYPPAYPTPPGYPPPAEQPPPQPPFGYPPEQAPPEQPLPEQAPPEQPLPEQPLPEQPLPEQPLPEQPLPEQAPPEQPLPEQAPPEQALPEQAPPEQAPPGYPTPPQPLPEQPPPASPTPPGYPPPAEQPPPQPPFGYPPACPTPPQPLPEQPPPAYPHTPRIPAAGRTAATTTTVRVPARVPHTATTAPRTTTTRTSTTRTGRRRNT